jgi:flagellar M-ring protein FliF
VLLLVVRPLVRRIITPDERALAPSGAGAGGSLPSGMAVAALTAESSADPAKAAEPNQTAKMIDIAQIQGQVHAQSVQKVGELADKNPRETVSIIRSWLNDSAAA